MSLFFLASSHVLSTSVGGSGALSYHCRPFQLCTQQSSHPWELGPRPSRWLKVQTAVNLIYTAFLLYVHDYDAKFIS